MACKLYDLPLIRCGCKLPEQQHDHEVREKFRKNGSSHKKWDRNDCTIDYSKTNAYGDIVFPGASKMPSKVSIILFPLLKLFPSF